MSKSIRIATRRSQLALWQAEHVASLLRAAHPGLTVELVPMTTQGDRVQDRALAEVGGKGLFVKELEVAMQEGRADIAVHSMKDVPSELPPGFCITAALARANPRDAFISRKYTSFAALPNGARVGTSSPRRQAQLRHARRDLRLELLRGNVDTRLRRLDEGGLDAILLACAGLERLGIGHHVTEQLDLELSLPAVGQGVIGIECREDDAASRAALAALHHEETFTLPACRARVRRHARRQLPLPDRRACDPRPGTADRARFHRRTGGRRDLPRSHLRRAGRRRVARTRAGGAHAVVGRRDTARAPAPGSRRTTVTPPLAGLTLVVTRPQRQAGHFIELATRAGARCLALPALEIEPVTLDAATSREARSRRARLDPLHQRQRRRGFAAATAAPVALSGRRRRSGNGPGAAQARHHRRCVSRPGARTPRACWRCPRSAPSPGSAS